MGPFILFSCKAPGRLIWLIVILFASAFCPSLSQAQCTEHPLGKTAVKFNNETRRDLTFYIDRDETGMFVPSKQVSDEHSVIPGAHLLRAIAKVNDKEVWVWVINEIPAGQLCIWTVADPQFDPGNSSR